MASQKLRDHAGVKRHADGMQAQLSALVVDPGWNARIRDQALEDHIDNISLAFENGAKLDPLDVYVNDEGQLIIVDGHCRNEAMLRAVVRGVPVEWVAISEFTGNDADRVAHMFTSSQGKSLTQYEQAEAFKRLVGYKWTHADIAKRVGRSVGFVESMLKLANADSETKELVKSGQVSVAAAVQTVRKSGGKAGKILKDKVAKARAKAKPGAVVKVSEKDMDDSLRLPKQFRDKLVTFFDNLSDNMGPLVYNDVKSLVGMTAEQLADESAEVSMTLLVSLINIGDEVKRLIEEQGK